jgi:hypothetical protein
MRPTNVIEAFDRQEFDVSGSHVVLDREALSNTECADRVDRAIRADRGGVGGLP